MEAKKAAAVAAVFSYLAQRKAGGQPATAGLQADTTGFLPGPWALYGRQALMSQAIRLQARRGT
jgi:hypothetical protein